MNDQQFNPQENTPHSSYNPNPGNPNPNAGAQQQAGGSNPHGNPNTNHPNAGNPNTGNPNPGQQSHQSYPGQQPPPDPQKMAEDQFAYELEQAYAEYERITASADNIGKRDEVKSDVVDSIKKTAKAKLERKIAEATERFSARTAQQGFTNAYPNFQGKPHPSSKVYRADNDKMIAGVCGGLAEFFGIDSTWVRLFFVLTTCFYLTGLLAYIVLSVILPVKTSTGEFRKMF